jgi:4-diphosphocytidyl-2-C-methyl-D-erythritol kinase
MTWTHTVFVPAYAKVNLTLEVLGRRADGYHDLASIMQTISLHDTLALHPAPPGEFTLTCDVEELIGPDNLALRAARALATACEVASGVRIELRKETPTQAGLGGGSSDAAVVLLALPRLWGADLPLHRMTQIAAELGSDVPFFLTGGAAIVTGRGERVAPLPDLPPTWIVLCKPPVDIATGPAFAGLAIQDFASGSHSAALAESRTASGDVPDEHMVNSFETSIRASYPEVDALWHAFQEAGAETVHLSGSGPTLFAMFAELTMATRVWRRLRAQGHKTWVSHTIGRSAAHAALDALVGTATEYTPPR